MADHDKTARKAGSGSRTRRKSGDYAVEQSVVDLAQRVGRMMGTVQSTTDDLLNRAPAVRKMLGRKWGPAVRKAASSRNARTVQGRRERSGGAVDAPGKRHRKPVPSAHGVKKSDQMIAKLKAAQEKHQRQRG